MARVIDFLNDIREDLRSSMAKDAVVLKNESIQLDIGHKCSDISNLDGGHADMQNERQLLYDFQRKINFSKNEMQDSTFAGYMETKMLNGSLLDTMENEDQLLVQLLHTRGMVVEKLKSDRQQIVLVASLVDRIPNLAGLARTCEVFRAAGLAIADKSILNDKQFQLISITADKWVPILEVPVENMKTFLEKSKQDGFALLGLEQTANSFPLHQYKFPKKSASHLHARRE